MYKYIFLLLIGILPAQKIENAVQPEDYKFEIYKSAQQIQTLVESNRGIYLDNVLVMQVVQQSRNQTARIIAKEDISAFDTIAKIDGFSIFVSQIDSINTEQALAKLQVHYSFEGKNYLVEKEVFCKKDRGKWKFAMDFNSDSFFQRLKTITYKQKSQGKNKETFAIRESPYAMIQTSFSDNPYILELNKSLAQSYLNDDIFSEATELDGDVIWYGPNWPEDVAAFVIDRDLSQIVYGDYNYSQWTVKGYGRNDNDFHFARAEAITTDYNNNVYVADFGLNAIIKLHYNTSSRMLEFVKKIEVKGNPVDVAFTQEISPYGTEGYLYVAINNSVDKILLLNTDGVLRDSYKSYTTDLQTYSDIIRPSRITCNKRSAFCFYFIDDIKRSFQSVYKWGWGDGTLFCSNKTEFPGNSCPTDVGIDGNSNPIVLDRGNGCLHTFSLTGKYLCSYKLTGGINSPKRISNYGSIKPGYYCINNTLSEQWSLTSGLRAFYTGADVFDLQFSILDEQRYCFSYIPSGCIQRKVEILDQNNCLIKTLANDSWCGDLHTFEVLKSELPLASGLKFKVHYLPVDNAHFGSDAQPWRTKEITFNTMVAPTIAGISPNIIKVRQGSATQVSAYLQPGPVGTVGYFWAGDLFPAGAVIEQDGSPVATIRYNRNKAKEMQNFSFSPKTPSSIGVLAQNFIGMAGFSKPVEFIKARSCPFIYTWQDSLWVEDNNILPQSQDEGQRGVLTDDYYNLYTKPALTADETYRLAIGEFEQEQSFIDLTKLIIVDHPLETDITVDDSGRVYQFAKPAFFASAQMDTLDVLKMLFAPDSVTVEAEANSNLEMSFQGTSPGTEKWMVLAAHTVAKDKKSGIVKSKNSEAFSDFRLRRNQSFVWVPVHQDSVSTVMVDVLWKESSTIDYAELSQKMELPFTVTVPELLSAVHSADGDVLQKLLVEDGDALVLSPNQWVTLDFRAPRLAEGMERSFIFASKGYYQLYQNNKAKTSGVNDKNLASEKPKDYALMQNSPNPFNPSTVIQYQLPKDGQVKITLFDILGREVMVLVDDYKTAGSYSYQFNAAWLSSGVYIYRMDSGNFHTSKKLTLLK